MTELAVRDQGAALALVPTPSEAVHAALEQWVGGMAASVRGAEYIVDTPMCPDAFWPLPPNVKSKTPKQLLPGEDLETYRERRRVATYTLGSVVRYGLQLGMPPEVAVQGIFTIGGRMSMYAEQMVALIKSQGHGHRVVERTRERCTVEVCRRGTDEWHPYTFTFEDAVTAGYVPRQGPNPANPGTWPDGKPKPGAGNEKYLTDPASMLYARCSSIACRTEFPDILRGLTSYEDMQDEQRVTVTVADAEPTPTPRMSAAAILARAEQAAPAIVDVGGPDPKPDPHAVLSVPDPAPEPEVQRYVLPVSKRRLDLIKAAFEKHGYSGRAASVRADRMRILSILLDRPTDRPVEDPRELTSDEAALILDHIGPDVAGPAIAAALDTGLWPSAEDADPGRLEDAAAVDEATTGEPYDPTTDADWAPEAGGDR